MSDSLSVFCPAEKRPAEPLKNRFGHSPRNICFEVKVSPNPLLAATLLLRFAWIRLRLLYQFDYLVHLLLPQSFELLRFGGF
ncbi:hypothetical protein MFFC18_32380 [Mariniblastus fucicola]|uniref:Uncharacterized protein n=1 Tax=Mariniblastus fucicola TaxID=980251 RepID=A0A5B9PDY0_9BACT|nr:hypothetical protein MFFC18_32380 [Mariniblastus fucicola]